MDTNFKKVSDFLHSKNSIAIKDELKGRLACLYNALVRIRIWPTLHSQN